MEADHIEGFGLARTVGALGRAVGFTEGFDEHASAETPDRTNSISLSPATFLSSRMLMTVRLTIPTMINIITDGSPLNL
jgi:hypothetical protein